MFKRRYEAPALDDQDAPLPPRRRARPSGGGQECAEAAPPSDRRRVAQHDDPEERRVRQFHHRTFLHLRAAICRAHEAQTNNQARH
jgi:hypothetical protein